MGAISQLKVHCGTTFCLKRAVIHILSCRCYGYWDLCFTVEKSPVQTPVQYQKAIALFQDGRGKWKISHIVPLNKPQ